MGIVEVTPHQKVCEIITIGCLYPELDPLGSLDPIQLVTLVVITWGLQLSWEDSSRFKAFVVDYLGPPIKLWRLLQTCTGLVTTSRIP
jgi:hypothetical protein